MPVEFEPMRFTTGSDRRSIFLSGSIPDKNRWDGDFDALEITDAVVSFARACLTRGFCIVSAAHPTLAPLLLYVAAEFPADNEPRVFIYQSLLFESVLPTATRRFEAEGIGELIWTESVEGDEPIPGRWDKSLALMRQRMLSEADPAAAVFVGGMTGIRDEFDLFSSMFPGRPFCAPARPGGEASLLEHDGVGPYVDEADRNEAYPTLWNRFLKSLDGSGSP